MNDVRLTQNNFVFKVTKDNNSDYKVFLRRVTLSECITHKLVPLRFMNSLALNNSFNADDLDNCPLTADNLNDLQKNVVNPSGNYNADVEHKLLSAQARKYTGAHYKQAQEDRYLSFCSEKRIKAYTDELIRKDEKRLNSYGNLKVIRFTNLVRTWPKNHAYLFNWAHYLIVKSSNTSIIIQRQATYEDIAKMAADSLVKKWHSDTIESLCLLATSKGYGFNEIRSAIYELKPSLKGKIKSREVLIKIGIENIFSVEDFKNYPDVMITTAFQGNVIIQDEIERHAIYTMPNGDKVLRPQISPVREDGIFSFDYTINIPFDNELTDLLSKEYDHRDQRFIRQFKPWSLKYDETDIVTLCPKPDEAYYSAKKVSTHDVIDGLNRLLRREVKERGLPISMDLNDLDKLENTCKSYYNDKAIWFKGFFTHTVDFEQKESIFATVYKHGASATRLKDLTVESLKNILKTYNRRSSGKKDELINRIEDLVVNVYEKERNKLAGSLKDLNGICIPYDIIDAHQINDATPLIELVDLRRHDNIVAAYVLFVFVKMHLYRDSLFDIKSATDLYTPKGLISHIAGTASGFYLIPEMFTKKIDDQAKEIQMTPVNNSNLDCPF